MDCSKLRLLDCPAVNLTITNLILDDNSLTSLATENCEEWSHLRELSLQRNNLKQLLDFGHFDNLDTLRLSFNLLVQLRISSNSLRNLHISNNLIKSVDKSGISLPALRSLDISWNEIDRDNLNNLIDSLKTSAFIHVLDVSYNRLEYLPINLMNFAPHYLSTMNFSGNQIRSVSFGYFHWNLRSDCSIDLSNNRIDDWLISEIHLIEKLNLSRNHLTRIPVKNLMQLKHLRSIDLSENPLNCSCSETASLTEWVKTNRAIVQRQSHTTCQYPPNENIFNIDCHRDSSTIVMQMNSTSGISVSSIGDNYPWKIIVIVMAICVTIMIILTGIWINHLRYGSRVNDRFSSKFNCCFHKRTECPGISHDYLSVSTNESMIFNYQDSLMIVCSSRDSLWIISELLPVLSIKNQIIDSKMRQLPQSDFTLIVVNGDGCLKDHIFLKNAQMAIESSENSETRLLIRKMPKYQNFSRENRLVNFMRNVISDKCYFRYEQDNHEACLDSLKLWLNLDL